MTTEGVRGDLTILSLCVALVFVILFGLGTWQLDRKARKEVLIEQIQSRATAEPIFLDGAATLFNSGEDLEYTPVRARGRFLIDKEMFYYASGATGPGYHVYTPLVGPSGLVLIVNRGFISESERKLPRVGKGDNETVDIVGLLRRPGVKAMFTPSNEPGRNLWYWRDLEGMANQSLGSAPAARKQVLPFFIDAVSPPAGAKPAPGVPRGGVTRLELPNRHLEYALTWYGLAVTLIGVYVAFLRNHWLSTRKRNILGASRRRSWGKT